MGDAGAECPCLARARPASWRAEREPPLQSRLQEFDVDGGDLTGTIPRELVTCFPQIDEIDLSYNQARQ